MQGNLLVRFLGGGGAVMRCCYPTCLLLWFNLQRHFSQKTNPAVAGFVVSAMLTVFI